MSGYTEACGCGRTGDLAEREPYGSSTAPQLHCPRCGHVETLSMLHPAEAARIWQEAVDRRPALVAPAAPELAA